MRVISKARLRQFWELPGYEDSEGPVRAWYTHVNDKSVAWQSWSDFKADFASASIVGNCVVFNIGGNKYRLVTRVLFPSQKVFVLKAMTHAEYDDEKWKDECGCYDSAPKPPTKRVQPPKRKRSKRKG